MENIQLDHLEYYVQDADLSAHWHVEKIGFRKIAEKRVLNENSQLISVLVAKGSIKLVFTSEKFAACGEIFDFISKHGEGIKRIAVAVTCVDSSFSFSVKNGGKASRMPAISQDANGSVITASIRFFDDNEITFINKDDYKGIFMPGFRHVEDTESSTEETHLSQIDHVAYALNKNELQHWESYFNKILDTATVLNFSTTESVKAGISLKILQSNNKLITNVLTEPLYEGPVKSQIDIFTDAHNGNGVQHIAFETSNIFKTVESLRNNGVNFVPIPDSYYSMLRERYPHLDIERFKKFGILCDVEDNALLLQIFTFPIGNRPTLFYEFVQRVNDYFGFGVDNIETLFLAVEANIASYGNTI